MRIDTIVVGMDFSPVAIATAEWVATRLAPDAELILTHALERPPRPPFPYASTLPPSVLEIDAKAYIEDRLREVSERMGPRVARTEVRVGRAHDVIAQCARRYSADLIVVGPHGDRAHESMLLGTTADALVHSAPVTVLVGARVPSPDTTRVVAGAADSSVRREVFEWADHAAQQLGGRLTVVYAVEPSAYAHLVSMAEAHAHGNERVERAEVEGEMRWQATRWLRECTAAGIDASRVDPVVEQGRAAEVLLDVARHEHAALIVLGRHGSLRGVPAVLGRTVRHVLHGAHAGVLVVAGR